VIERILVIAVLLPVGMFLIHVGGLPYDLFIACVLGMAGWEYVQLFRRATWKPGIVLVVGGVFLLALERSFFHGVYSATLVSLLILISMASHLFQYERGRDEAGIDFGITMGGLLYLGWLGPYLISMRALPDGKWWILLVLPTVWMVDVGAYLVGSRFGRHPMAPRLSPRKTWEGYMGGAISGVVFGMLFTLLWGIWYPHFTLLQGAVIGLVMGILSPLGDLGESMFKRMVGVKDSSKLLPGHGGVFDRIDSWLWAGVLGYIIITGFWVIL
jgi:phosphatidate cytidylyltransferase